jgi:hypothetical protein
MVSVNDISNELESVVVYIQSLFPTARVERQNVPDETHPNLFVVRFLYEDRITETRVSMRIERDWEIIYFGEDTLDVFNTMSKLSKSALDYRIVIPIKDSLRYMRVNNYAISEPFETKSDKNSEWELNGIAGTMMTETREARTMEAFNQIMNVSTVVR